MSHALISGKLYARPERRTTKNGNAYATATVLVNDGAARQFWSVATFDDGAVAELLRMKKNDAIGCVGRFTAEIYEKDGKPRVSMKMTADRVIGLRREPKAPKEKGNGYERRRDAPDDGDYNHEPY